MKRQLRQRLVRGGAARGMTLVEIMIVVIVMALIATGVAYAVVPLLYDAQLKQTRIDTRRIQGAASMYMMRNQGECPISIDDLSLASSGRRTDAWGNDFIVECDSDDGAVIISPGRDRELGTDDDVSSSDPADPA